MKKGFLDLDKILDNRIRLSILSILMIDDMVPFKEIKESLELTDGNLASHIKALEKAEYITIYKSFVGKKPNTEFKISKLGKKAFTEHLKKNNIFLSCYFEFQSTFKLNIMKIKSQKMIYFKIGFILLLILLLVIPNAMLQGLINERKGLANQTKVKIAETWGGKQQMHGPVLSIPYYQTIMYDDGNQNRVNGWYHILPDEMNIEGILNPNIRTLGIYDAIVYESDMNVDGVFNLDKLEKIQDKNSTIEFDKAILSASVKDINGISGGLNGNWNGETFEFEKGSPVQNIFPKGGFHHPVDLSESDNILPFDFNLKIKGTENITFIPTASTTNVNISSSWASPSFIGRSPSHDITNEGFTAQWSLNEHNRPFAGQWVNENVSLTSQKGFGVNLIHGVDHYQKNMRSAKYATLIIALTFMVYFFFEIIYKNKIHPIQYSLIGIALSLFYYLLLSFSEHISFSYSYIIAAIGTIGLITSYSITLVKDKKTVSVLFLILIALYSYIFVLLQLEDFALLAGSIGLFVILAIVMYLSRNMNWYQLHPEEGDNISQAILH